MVQGPPNPLRPIQQQWDSLDRDTSKGDAEMACKRHTAEGIIGKLRDALLNREIFYTRPEAQVPTAAWREEYERRRPHGSLGYRPPAPGGSPRWTARRRARPPSQRPTPLTAVWSTFSPALSCSTVGPVAQTDEAAVS